MATQASRASTTGWITVTGARTHNLRGVDVTLPRDAVVAFVGVSGSGKTSLAIDTLHAEAQLRYIEGLAPFVRQYISPRDRPQVDRVTGLGATLAVDQRRLNRNSRSTLATLTGVDAYLGLLYSRIPSLAGGGNKVAELSSSHFDRYSADGGCTACSGAGVTLSADPDLIIVNPDAPLAKGASTWFDRFRSGEQAAVPFLAGRYGADLEQPWRTLPAEFRNALLHGTGDQAVDVSIDLPNKNSDSEVTVRWSKPLIGAVADVERLFAAAKTESAKQRYLPYMRMVDCVECGATGFGVHSRTERVGGLTYAEVVGRPVSEAAGWLARIETDLTSIQREVAQALVPELAGRVGLLGQLGLGHIQLSRPAPTMSGGELQRARMVGQLASGLTGIVYVLDEPTSGLHPADKVHLVDIICGLRDAGNTVLLVEHDTELIAKADWVVEIGPGAGERGGTLVASCPPAELADFPQSRTAPYLSGVKPRVSRPRRAPALGWLTLLDARSHNVHLPELRLPLGVLTCLTGISGSGKSSLLRDCLGDGVATVIEGRRSGSLGSLRGGEAVGWVSLVDQEPIGRTPRSNPATYSKAFDSIRALFADTDAARAKGLSAADFSFNSGGGRCEACAGYGLRSVDMHFLPDVTVVCEACAGRRFGPAVLSVRYCGLSVDEVLALTVDEAAEVLTKPAALTAVLRTLRQVGLGYLQLGQSSTELSGGEAQRLKLAATLTRGSRGRRPGLVLLDEPVTGLHPDDVQRLVNTFDAILDTGSTVVLAEHDLHVAAAADWVVDLGPGSGDAGGRICAEGPPEEIAAAGGPTAAYLARLVVTDPAAV
ncbi:excinuclease ABC subunit UvrA [Frankia sp. BMG5.23]|uniref:excinuclease ABC subunit UvrA n=1 Tax=Frankia sp. BMG5.23 TaxID=683305 RepID=UPI000460AC57|nr:excinuclease ABC subunit UvrA [Frankia sp. BMG5.23]KDA41642.1 Excinuclease ATPase subunit [Frankia sp. BMG5.23]